MYTQEKYTASRPNTFEHKYEIMINYSVVNEKITITALLSRKCFYFGDFTIMILVIIYIGIHCVH